MRRTLAILLLTLMACGSLAAQTTKVRGRVTDADTGDPIPFAGVFFKGTSIGISADSEGYYSLETRDSTARVLVCYLLGYDTQERDIKSGVFTQADFALKLHDVRLSGASVKADNRKAKRLLALIEANRDRNDPEKRLSYQCDIYSKVELDLANAREQLQGTKAMKQFDFVFDYVDTSAVSGRSYLPALMSESVIHRRHLLNPAVDTEEILGNRVSGINPDANLLTQFTGSMHLKINFYKPFINAFGLELPSPLKSDGLLYYNYFIIDSVKLDGRKTYQVRYHPKTFISSPAFDGEMNIDAEDFALRSIHARMKHGGNVNWLRDLALDAEYERSSDGTWFYRQDDIYGDFSVVMADSSRVMSVLGTRKMTFSNPSFEPQEMPDLSSGIVKVNPEANFRDEHWWQNNRPFELSHKERGIYTMVDRIKEQPLYKVAYDFVSTLVNGYYDVGPVGFGQVFKTFSANNLEGFRPRFGMHTSTQLSKKWRWSGYLAYGFRDHQFKGGLTYERMLSKDPTSKLTLDAHYDVTQIGRAASQFTMDNILNSLWYGNQKLCPMSEFSALYEHEFSMDCNVAFSASAKRWYANEFVPMVTRDGTGIPSLASNELHLQTRFSHEETVNRGHFIKKYVHSRYPVFTVDLSGSVPGLRSNDWGYFRPELTLDWVFNVPPLGKSKMRASTGTILGQVPYPLLFMYGGNATNLVNRNAFSCMDYFEFAADTWATFFWLHNFHGFFLGKIPFLRDLKLREEVELKMAYGTLREENNPQNAPLVFPEGMTTLGKVPYVEVSAGLSNIFKILRVDGCWRLTHRRHDGPNFKVMVGIDFSF